MRINHKAIGEGIYDMMPDEDRAVVAFGMIPIQWMELVSRQFREKCARMFFEGYEIDEPEGSEWFKRVCGSVKQSVINDFERDITVAIFQAATKAGKMIA